MINSAILTLYNLGSVLVLSLKINDKISIIIIEKNDYQLNKKKCQ